MYNKGNESLYPIAFDKKFKIKVSKGVFDYEKEIDKRYVSRHA